MQYRNTNRFSRFLSQIKNCKKKEKIIILPCSCRACEKFVAHFQRNFILNLKCVFKPRLGLNSLCSNIYDVPSVAVLEALKELTQDMLLICLSNTLKHRSILESGFDCENTQRGQCYVQTIQLRRQLTVEKFRPRNRRNTLPQGPGGITLPISNILTV